MQSAIHSVEGRNSDEDGEMLSLLWYCAPRFWILNVTVTSMLKAKQAKTFQQTSATDEVCALITTFLSNAPCTHYSVVSIILGSTEPVDAWKQHEYTRHPKSLSSYSGMRDNKASPFLLLKLILFSHSTRL